LYRYVPRALIERPKRGFAVPLAAWLRGPLRPWADELLAPAAIAQSAVLDVSRVRQLWAQHSSGIANHGDRLWTLLTLQSYLLAGESRTKQAVL
jgi:asparagine synthase (glutamine-hydrolysing)